MITKRNPFFPMIIGLQLLVLYIVLHTGIALAVPAGVSRFAPDKKNSTPNGAHVFFPRMSPTAGVQRDLKFIMYYPKSTTNSDWNDSYLEFRPGGNLYGQDSQRVCEAKNVGNNSIQDEFMSVILQDPLPGGDSKEFKMKRTNVCSERGGNGNNRVNQTGSNTLYAKYSLPNKPASEDPTTNHFKIEVTVKFNDGIGRNQDAGGMRLLASTPTNNAKIGQVGGANRSFPVIADWDLSDTDRTDINVPFGYCTGADTETTEIGIYDADQVTPDGDGLFSGNIINFKVYDNTDNKYIDLTNVPGNRGQVSDNGKKFTPNNGTNKDYAYVKATFEKFHKYEIQIYDVHPRNTIDVNLPFESIFGEESIDCEDPSAKIVPKAGPDYEITLGEQATFTNWVKTSNTSETGNDTFTWEFRDASAAGLSLPSGAFDGATPKIKPDRDLPTPEGRQTFTFTPTVEGKYCRQTKISNYPNYVNDTKGVLEKQCIKVNPIPPPPDPTNRSITLQPVVDQNGSEVEAESPAEFKGYVKVEGYPTDKTDWGYTQQSVQLPAVIQGATVTQYGLTGYQNEGAYNGSPSYSCPNGGTLSGSTCNKPETYTCQYQGGAFTPGCPLNNIKVITGPASTYPASTTYTCPAGWSGGGGTSFCSRYRYKCAETNTYGAWNTTPSCKNYYVCQKDTGKNGWYLPNGPICNDWKCQYPDAEVVLGPQPTCEARCNGGRAGHPGTASVPGRAPLATGTYYETGDRNCYIEPRFRFTCEWRAESGALLSTAPAVNVNSSNYSDNHCPSTGSIPTTSIGQEICILYWAIPPASPYFTPPSPGTGTGDTWRVTGGVKKECKKVVGKPYVRVVGGDVTTGIGAGATAASCPAASGQATINAQNKGSSGQYAGSGASVATLAKGTINGFASGQFANASLGSAPTALTFANTGGGFGGGWGRQAACVDISQFAPNTSTQPAGSMSGINKFKTNSSITIGGDITYASNSWTSIENIPLIQVVVEGGDIYIDRNVARLDGTYIALRKNGVGGNIYTCSIGASPITQTFDQCRGRQLVVNGALIADKVHLSRDCGTLNRSAVNETTVFSGGAGNGQTCNTTGTNAAEVFNFLPEQWIRSSVGVPSTRYDAITNMPPTL